MGIPSYFSFIVKNHGNIVRKIHKLNKNIDNFYLDSNSIVYDCLRALDKNYKDNDEEFERLLIEAVCRKIDEYISIIQPSNNVLIAFDGVAPVAKLEQQILLWGKFRLKLCNISVRELELKKNWYFEIYLSTMLRFDADNWIEKQKIPSNYF